MSDFYSYRITYEKTGVARYIGHLDLQNLFHRAMRRGGLKARYSQGFNPHPIISFASPLSVGAEGLGEIADIDLAERVCANEFITKLNPALPAGLSARFCEEVPVGTKKSASLLRKAAYEIRVRTPEGSEPCLENCVKDFLSEGTEIRNLVFELTARRNVISAVIACGGNGNLKPSVLAEILCGMAGVPFCGYKTEYSRRELIF